VVDLSREGDGSYPCRICASPETPGCCLEASWMRAILNDAERFGARRSSPRLRRGRQALAGKPELGPVCVSHTLGLAQSPLIPTFVSAEL